MPSSSTCRSSRRPRLLGWLISTLIVLLLMALAAPEQMPVIGYKLALVMLGAVLAYWIDRALFPYARPHACAGEWPLAMASIRRALIVLACVLGLTLGL